MKATIRVVPKALYRPRDAAEILGISKSTIYRWIKAGKINVELQYNRYPYIRGHEIARVWDIEN